MNRIGPGPPAVVLLLAAVAGTSADEAASADVAAEYVPARFEGGAEQAAATIEYPMHKGDVTVFLNCGVRVTAAGHAENAFCIDYYGTEDTRFQRAARKYLGRASFEPARVNGVAVPVNFFFRVFFGKQGDNHAVGLYPNWGDDTDRLGFEYFAPQLYEPPKAPSACMSAGGIFKVTVDETGKATGDVEMIRATAEQVRESDCDRWYTDTAKNGRYIPAMHEGKPVSATYTAVWGDPVWISLKRPEGF